MNLETSWMKSLGFQTQVRDEWRMRRRAKVVVWIPFWCIINGSIEGQFLPTGRKRVDWLKVTYSKYGIIYQGEKAPNKSFLATIIVEWWWIRFWKLIRLPVPMPIMTKELLEGPTKCNSYYAVSFYFSFDQFLLVLRLPGLRVQRVRIIVNRLCPQWPIERNPINILLDNGSQCFSDSFHSCL